MSVEEETGGLGLGLNALFGEDDDNPIAELERQIREEIAEEDAQEDAVNFSALMDEDIDSSNDDVAADAPAPVVSDDGGNKVGRTRHMIPIERLYPSKFQPRRIFSEDSINELAGSIAQYGVLQPLLVREDPTNPDHYEIIAGERRWRASQKAQIHELPVVLLELEELEAFKIALIENLQREDLDPIDEAWGYKKLLEEYDQTQEQLASAVGKSRPHITNMIRLLGLPEDVQAHLGTGDLSMGHARALINAKDPSVLATQVVKKGLSVRQTESLVKKEKTGKSGSSKPKGASQSTTPAKSADTIALENDISNALGMNVTIDSTDGKTGKLSVEFKSLDQLDEVLHRLAHYPGARLNG